MRSGSNNFRIHGQPSYPVRFNDISEGLKEFSNAAVSTIMIYHKKEKQIKINSEKKI